MMGELGVYSDFPPFTHLDIRFSLNISGTNVTTLITRSLSRLNGVKDSIDTSVAGHSGAFLVKRSFEVGIAEGLYFNYLDGREIDRVCGLSAPLSSLDFIVYVNYRYLKRRKFVNLLPDRYIIRFSFSSFSIKIFQMSGLRRTEPEELVIIVTRLINDEVRSNGFDKDLMTIDYTRELQKN